MDAIIFLIYPFIACILLILINTYFGTHILERGIIFVDLSLAQFIGLGIAISFLSGDSDSRRQTYAIIFGIAGAFILSLSRHVAKYINIEAFIGAIYIFSFATSILVLDRSPHGLEEFKTIFNGNIIWTMRKDVTGVLIVYFLVGLFHLIFRKKFSDLSFGNGNSLLWEFLFFFTFAITIVKSVQMAGILQVFASLIIPALIGRLFFRDTVKILIMGWVIGAIASIAGTILSYKMDLPTSPLIVSILSLSFFILLIAKIIISRGNNTNIK